MIDIKDKMKLFENHKVVNWHEHIWSDNEGKFDEKHTDLLVESAMQSHMDIVVCSNPITFGNPRPEEMRHNNDVMAMAMKRHPKVIKGLAYINPGYSREAVQEIDRCINELGMIGIKLYNQYYISDPIVRPVIEKCIELDIPILEHAGKLTFEPESQPFISDGTHFAAVSKEYPEATIIEAHICGGGDWQWCLKAIADCPNIYTDTSGSVCDQGILEKTAETLGVDRMLFGTDCSFAAGIGKILSCKLSEEDKAKILNNKKFEHYLERGLK